ncbi:hypothetical protein [Pseudogemmobacter bohemicus]|uniref:hypothetical protein n=1 Tax=Pseudogemmobacter bohemicus TaxID=2250708 RepID=UPI001300185B|nr:hypothetical protein [Pseudogemmobacter bohemicus]
MLDRTGIANFDLIVFAARCSLTVLRYTAMSRAISQIDSFCRKCMRRMMFKSAM